jgi:O-antigen ligase
MVCDQEFSNSMTLPAADADGQWSFPWGPAILISTLLFLAENYWPADVVEGVTVDAQVSLMQGSVLRELCYITLSLIGIIYLFRAKGYRPTLRSPLGVAFGSLVAWCALSAMWAEEPATSIKRMIAYLFMITGAAGVATLWSRRQIVQFISLSGAAHLGIGVVAEIFIGRFTPWVADYRFAGTQHWNVQGFCCLFLVLSSLAAGDSDPRHKRLFRTLALCGLAFLVLTKSRSSMMGVTAGLLVYFMLTRSLATKVWVGLAAATSLLILYMGGFLTSMTNFLSRGGEGVDNLTGRQPMWELAMTFVRRRPATGYGYQDFWTVSNVDYFSSEFHWPVSSAHNAYLETLLGLGYFGMALHVLVLTLGIVRGSFLFRKTRSPIFALAAAIFTAFLVVGGLEAVVLWAPGPYNFGTMLLIWSFCLQREKAAGHEHRLLPLDIGWMGRKAAQPIENRST